MNIFLIFPMRRCFPRAIYVAPLVFAMGLNVPLSASDQRLSDYVDGESLSDWHQLRNRINQAAATEYPEIERLILAQLEFAGERSPQAVRLICELLGRVGGTKSVDALQPYLLDPVTSDYARIALEAIPDAKALKLLQKSLPDASESVAPGIISSIAAKQDSRSIPVLIKAAKKRKALTIPVLSALGCYADSTAVMGILNLLGDDTLEGDCEPDSVAFVAQESLSRIAESAARQGETELAHVALRRVSEAFPGSLAVRADLKSTSKNALDYLDGIMSGHSDLSPTAARIEARNLIPGERSFENGFFDLSVEERIVYLNQMGAVTDERFVPLIVKSLGDAEIAVRIEAARAAANYSDASLVKPLLELAKGSGEDAGAANYGLKRMGRGSGKVDAEIIRVAKTGGDVISKTAWTMAATRGVPEAIDTLFGRLVGSDPEDYKVAFSILNQSVDGQHIPEIAKAMRTVEDEGKRRQFGRLILSAVSGLSSQVSYPLFAQAMRENGLESDPVFISLLPRIGGRDAWIRLSELAVSENQEISRSATATLLKTATTLKQPEAAFALVNLISWTSDADARKAGFDALLGMAGEVRMRGNEREELQNAMKGLPLGTADLQKLKCFWFPEDILINEMPEPDLDAEGFQSLFDGKTLDGWKAVDGTARYVVDNGAILGTCDPESRHNSFLITERDDYSDFVFTCEFKWEVFSNSGVQFRSGPDPDTGLVHGYQAEMDASQRAWTAGIYGEKFEGWIYGLAGDLHAERRNAVRLGDWNRLTIMADGDTLRTWLNGVPMGICHDDRRQSGYFGLQIHAGHQGQVRWRNLEVLELGQP